MKKNNNNIGRRKIQILLSLLAAAVLMFGCMTSVFAAPEDGTDATEPPIDLTEPSMEEPVVTTDESITQATEELTEEITEGTSETTPEITTEATEETTAEETTEPPENNTTEEIIQETTEKNPWDFEVPTEGTIEAEQSKADYFIGTVMWSAVGGGLLILLIMFIGKRKS